MDEVKEERAGVVSLILSFIFPIVGILCFFAYKKDVENPLAYLWAAIGGFVMGFILRMALA